MSDLASTPAPEVPNSGPPVSSTGSSLRKERGAIAAQVSCYSRLSYSRPTYHLTCLTLWLLSRHAIPVEAGSKSVTSSGPSAAHARSSSSSVTIENPSRPSKFPDMDLQLREHPTSASAIPLTSAPSRRKDKTLVEILERIKSLETKIDDLSLQTNFSPVTSFAPLQHATFAPVTALETTSGIHGPSIVASAFHIPDTSSSASGTEDHYNYVSSVHQMLSWPAVSQLLATVQPKVPSLDLSLLERDIPIPTLGTQSHNGKVLPVSASLASRSQGQGHAPTGHGSVPIPVSSLNWDTMQRLSKAYFDSINLVYPILDRQTFMSETLPSVVNQGFGGQGISSTIAFLVFALGETAIAGSEGQPVHIHTHNGRPSGVRGGSKDEPPGLDLFNEARKRMGFNLTECSLENVQIFALAR